MPENPAHDVPTLGKPENPAQHAATIPSAVEPTTLFGVTLSDIGKTFLSFIAGAAVASYVWWLNSAQPHLIFTVSNPVSFQGDKATFGIINFSITNDGSKEAKNIVATFKKQGGKDLDIKTTPEILKAEVSEKGEIVTVKIASLNAGETLDVVAYMPSVVAVKPDVTVRGENVVTVHSAERPPYLVYANAFLWGIVWGWTLMLAAICLICFVVYDTLKKEITKYKTRAEEFVAAVNKVEAAKANL